MQYPNLFKSRYPNLQGRNWIQSIESDDLQAFIEIGLQATDHGKKGGDANVRKHGRKHMRRIARLGGIISTGRKQWNKAVALETARLTEEGVLTDM